MSNRRGAFVGALFLVVITAIATFGFSALWFSSHPGSLRYFVPRRLASPGSPAGAPNMSLFWQVYDEVKSYYVDASQIDDAKLVEGAISGMVQSLGDPYSMYLDQTHYSALREELEPGFSGIGVYVDDKEVGGVSYVTVVAPMKGSPGEKAGLMAGDRLLAVDGQDLVGKTSTDAVKLIRGPKGTTVKLTVLRGENEQFTREIVRADIPYPTEEHKMLEGNIGYIRLYEFNQSIGKQTGAALEELKAGGARGIILDLRHNPGGLLDEAVSVASYFVPKGRVVSVVYGDGSRKDYDSDSNGLGLPLVVLVDEGSASASEIVAGAIKDRGTGTLVGTKTFGKGSVQNVAPLPGGSGLRLTIAKYLTPSGASIHKVGIPPNVEVPLNVPTGQQAPAPDAPDNPQLMKAVQILKGMM